MGREGEGVDGGDVEDYGLLKGGAGGGRHDFLGLKTGVADAEVMVDVGVFFYSFSNEERDARRISTLCLYVFFGIGHHREYFMCDVRCWNEVNAEG